MNNIIYTLILLGTLVNSATVLAKKEHQDCDNMRGNEQDYARCLDMTMESVDRELQTWINAQTFTLEELALKTGRSAALNMFVRSQSNFVKYREDNCRWQYLAHSPDPSASNTYKKCYILISNDRIKVLSQVAGKN